jgi:hypothetical protein
MNKNIAFTSLVRIEGRQYEFNFRKKTSAETIFHADVTNAKGERIMFTMIFTEGIWHTSGALLPAWIQKHTELIGQTIHENT